MPSATRDTIPHALLRPRYLFARLIILCRAPITEAKNDGAAWPLADPVNLRATVRRVATFWLFFCPSCPRHDFLSTLRGSNGEHPRSLKPFPQKLADGSNLCCCVQIRDVLLYSACARGGGPATFPACLHDGAFAAPPLYQPCLSRPGPDPFYLAPCMALQPDERFPLPADRYPQRRMSGSSAQVDYHRSSPPARSWFDTSIRLLYFVQETAGDALNFS